LNSAAQRILSHLEQVRLARVKCQADADLSVAVALIKRFQHARFEMSYADLLASARYGASARFFLDELYGARDFTDRDAQFARVVPALVRLFPASVVATVEKLAELHALSEGLDGQMAAQWVASGSMGSLRGEGYVALWQAVGCAEDRRRQVELMHEIGMALDRYTRTPLLRQMLQAMRGPARAAGLSSLQGFLERGFDTFKGMRGAESFLATIRERELGWLARLFNAQPGCGAPGLPGEVP
jgi:hypothetical protein